MKRFTHEPVPQGGTVQGSAPRRDHAIQGATAVKPWGSILIICILFFAATAATPQTERLWVEKSGGIINAAVADVSVKDEAVYLATSNELYKSKDGSREWRPIFSLPRGSNRIRCIGINTGSIFVGTERGLYRSEDGGVSWKSVFMPMLGVRSDVRCIDLSGEDPHKLLIGTGEGVFLSQDDGNGWTNLLKRKVVKGISSNGSGIYAVCEDGLFSADPDGRGWKRLIVAAAPDGETTEDDAAEEAEAEEAPRQRAVNCVTSRDGRLYAGLDKRLLYSDDNGASWKELPNEGLRGRVSCVLASRENRKIFVSTDKGVYELSSEGGRWVELYNGMPSVDVTKISFAAGTEDVLWSATDRGLFRLETSIILERREVEREAYVKNIYTVLDGEPSFVELEEAALRHNEVGPDKIAAWRREARLKALVPKLSLGFDKSRSSNIEFYTSATTHYIMGGPDDIKSGWDASLSWELGDLIWSVDQTSIDVRSKLMVQLRMDILDDLRRAYYERKRLLAELAISPPGDLKTRLEKELRLEELTSAIDGLTGNYLSKKKGRRYIAVK